MLTLDESLRDSCLGLGGRIKAGWLHYKNQRCPWGLVCIYVNSNLCQAPGRKQARITHSRPHRNAAATWWIMQPCASRVRLLFIGSIVGRATGIMRVRKGAERRAERRGGGEGKRRLTRPERRACPPARPCGLACAGAQRGWRTERCGARATVLLMWPRHERLQRAV